MLKRPPFALIALALAGGLLAGLLVFRSGSAPELEADDLTAAEELWARTGPSDYRMTLQMGGALTDRRSIEVREGRVVEMTIANRLTSESSWAYWSVEGMFGFLQAEIRNKQNPIPGMGVSDPRQIVLRARFDPDLGYPTYFLRHLLGRQQGTEWEVVAFEVLAD